MNYSKIYTTYSLWAKPDSGYNINEVKMKFLIANEYEKKLFKLMFWTISILGFIMVVGAISGQIKIILP